jgi:hypothetical protein
MPKKPAPCLLEDLWTATHQRPEGYHAKKTSSTSTRRPLDRKTSKARRLPCPKKRLHECQKTLGPQHTKNQKATMPKKLASHLPEDLWTTQHIKDQNATMLKKPAPRQPEDLWTATHQRPKGYHAQTTVSTSDRKPLDRITSKARRLPCPKNRLHICQKTF